MWYSIRSKIRYPTIERALHLHIRMVIQALTWSNRAIPRINIYKLHQGVHGWLSDNCRGYERSMSSCNEVSIKHMGWEWVHLPTSTLCRNDSRPVCAGLRRGLPHEHRHTLKHRHTTPLRYPAEAMHKEGRRRGESHPQRFVSQGGNLIVVARYFQIPFSTCNVCVAFGYTLSICTQQNCFLAGTHSFVYPEMFQSTEINDLRTENEQQGAGQEFAWQE